MDEITDAVLEIMNAYLSLLNPFIVQEIETIDPGYKALFAVRERDRVNECARIGVHA